MHKKNILIILFLILNIGLEANAQKDFNIGLQIGLNQSSLNGSTALIEPRPLYKMNIGIISEMYISKNYSLRSGIILETKGNKFDIFVKEGEFSGRVESENEYKYLTIPLLLKYTTDGKIPFFINAGPSVSLKSNSGIGVLSIKDIDAGINLGVGVQKYINKNIISFEIRYNKGLIDISDNSFLVFDKLTTTTISGLLSYSLNI